MAHPLEGCWAKIDRAKENIDNLHKEITDFINRDSAYKIVGHHKKEGLEYSLVAFGDPQVPLRFAVLAGEIIHHLRSSLDHLVYGLIIQNGAAPSKRSQFPICSTVEKFEDACKGGQIDGISGSAKKLIIAVQPYTSPTPEDTVLAVINQYDNFDKHRLLVIVSTIVKLGEEVTIGTNPEVASSTARQGKMPNIVGFIDPGPRKISEDGVDVFTIQLAEAAPELIANANLVPELAFEECGLLKFALVIPTLVGLFYGTKHTIETFAGEFK
jgi:hypothetical protein